MEQLLEDNFIKEKKYNQKLYKIYKMLSWDLICYYAISFLFLTQAKGLSTSQIIFADAFYPLFKLILQLPCTMLVEKLGKRNSLILGNLAVFTYILIVLGLTSTTGYIISNIFCAIGYTIKATAESNLLYDSIENTPNKRTIFSKIDGLGSSLYYYFDAITAIASGFLFAIDPYIPMIICLVITIISVFISYKFKDIKHETSEELSEADNPYKNLAFSKQLKFYIRDIKQVFKFILKSNRLRCLILFNAIFVTFICLMSTYRRSVLSELKVPNEYFGVIFAIWGLISGFASSSATYIQKTHGNRTLSFLGVCYCLSIIFAGLIAVLDLPSFLVYFFVLSLFTVHSVITGPYYTLIKQYLGSFSTSSMRTKITSANLLIENIIRTIISFIVSYLTESLSSATATFVLGISFTVTLLLILYYMKDRVGLKPEEYKKSDVEFTEIY